jgi:hypothetical protein
MMPMKIAAMMFPIMRRAYPPSRCVTRDDQAK